MSEIIPFGSNAPIPSWLAEKTVKENPFAAARSGGYAVISIKGKVFHIVTGEDRRLVTQPGTDLPAQFIEVVIIDANPNRSKTYYKTGFVEGSSEAPTCASSNGIRPDPGVEEPQSNSCALCPHNQWGSLITENGKRAKACADSMRLAVAPAGSLKDVMLLRVPAMSLNNLAAFGDTLARQGVPPRYVVTRLSFDASKAYPVLQFHPVRFVTQEEAAIIDEVVEEPIIKEITGVTVKEPEQASPKPAAAAPAAPPAQSEVAPAAPQAEPVQQPAPQPQAAEAAPWGSQPAPAAAAAKPAEPQPAPAAAKPAEPQPANTAGGSELDSALDDLLA